MYPVVGAVNATEMAPTVEVFVPTTDVGATGTVCLAIVNALSKKFPPESVALIVNDPDVAELEVPEITPLEEFNVIEEGRDPDATEYVIEEPPSASVADKVVEYARFVKNVGSVADVTQTGAAPTVIAFISLCALVDVGTAIPGFVAVIV